MNRTQRFGSPSTIEILQGGIRSPYKVFGAHTHNLIGGSQINTSVTITTVGRRLQDVYALVNKQTILDQVALAVEQLHSIGVAHCDIRVSNIFMNLTNDAIFLGDLEYCREMSAPAPTGLRGSDSRAATARELDIIQLSKLPEELYR